MVRVDWLITEMNVLGGAEMFVRLAAPRMRARGWDLHVITFSSGGYLAEQIHAESVPLIELGLQHKLNLSAVIKLLLTWKKDKPLLLHTHLYHAGMVGRVAGRLMGIHPIIVQQAGPEQNRSRLRTWWDRHTSFLVDCYLTTCEAVKKNMQVREHIPANQIAVIPNGIVLTNYQKQPPKPAMWPVTAPVPVLGTVGRLSPEKGHHNFLEAMSVLIQQGKNFHAIIIGDGPLKDELAQRTKILHLEEHVSWVGPQSNVPDWLHFFDLFVLPSHWEGISMALLEAMATGLPIVATDVGGNPEVIEHGRSGLLVAPSNPQQLSEAISRLIENPTLRQEMGQSGKKRCQERYNIEIIVEQLDALYKNILRSGTPK